MIPSISHIDPSKNQPENYSYMGTVGTWQVWSHQYSHNVLLWDAGVGVWINPDDHGSDFPRWSIDHDTLLDTHSRKGFDITFDLEVVA